MKVFKLWWDCASITKRLSQRCLESLSSVEVPISPITSFITLYSTTTTAIGYQCSQDTFPHTFLWDLTINLGFDSSRLAIPPNLRHNDMRYRLNDGTRSGNYRDKYKKLEPSTRDINKAVVKHSYRIIRGRDENSRKYRHATSRYDSGPYGRQKELTWREKSKDKITEGNQYSVRERSDSNVSHDIVPTKQVSRSSSLIGQGDHCHLSRETELRGGEHQIRRIASDIVFPIPQLQTTEDNVTVRRGFEDNALAYDDKDDDLMDEELRDMDVQPHSLPAGSTSSKPEAKVSKHSRSGSRMNAPLGIQTKKTEFLRRGSPRKRSSLSSAQKPKGVNEK
ncbi:unnamed protein product, partial [Eruca vesicaria subsp. sativa]|nr:unnamed protein product [Eruca vesicaria subsp. sativa]